MTVLAALADHGSDGLLDDYRLWVAALPIHRRSAKIAPGGQVGSLRRIPTRLCGWDVRPEPGWRICTV
jgi:hypothetical protein